MNNFCDKNINHPKQKNKILINDLIDRLTTNMDLFIDITGNIPLNNYLDVLLGKFKFGSITGHWIEPNGDRQISHVDYPIHVGSGPFWENSIDKLKDYTTKYQLNNILPFYSCQVIIATDKMGKFNGSTELIPSSHLIEDIDIKILDQQYKENIESQFINVELEQGDFLIFNRRLCHRGGKNVSNYRRNSIIAQCVWFWGIGQETIEEHTINYIKENEKFKQLNQEKQNMILSRITHPYPKNVKNST